MELDFKRFINTAIDTESGKAIIVSVCGKYAILKYKECTGTGWVDLSKLKITGDI
ncbi:MAG: hypothetical protein JJV99_05415 [Colwellia sp.]|nr:hypothetical protein [Colwellia sp.]|tara:strand:- start:802 stop:966 length:165 start_codon:yes stop_codon:yes gene_type:complete